MTFGGNSAGDTTGGGISGGSGSDTNNGGSSGNDTIISGSDTEETVAPVTIPAGLSIKGTALTVAKTFADDVIDLTEDYGRVVNKVDASALTKPVEIVGNDLGDFLKGGKFADTLNGETGNDTLTGGSGKDVFIYESGDDIITDYKCGEDSILLDVTNIIESTLKGSDVIITTDDGTLTVKGVKDNAITFVDEAGNTANRIFYAGESYEPLATGLTYDAKRTTLTVSNKYEGDSIDLDDYISSNVNAASAKQAMNITGTDSNNLLKGGKGADTIHGGAGNNTLTGGNGKDIFVHSNGNDVITDYKVGEDKIKLESGTITNSTVKGSDVILTTDNGTITVKSGNNKFIAVIDGDGNETSGIYFNGVFYREPQTGLSYDKTKTMLTASSKFTDTTIDLAEYHSTITKVNAASLSKGVEIIGNDYGDSLKGGKGADTILGGSGNDTLTGGNGKDVFIFTGGNDVITDYKAKEDKIQIANSYSTSVKGNDVIFTTDKGTLTVKNAKSVDNIEILNSSNFISSSAQIDDILNINDNSYSDNLYNKKDLTPEVYDNLILTQHK